MLITNPLQTIIIKNRHHCILCICQILKITSEQGPSLWQQHLTAQRNYNVRRWPLCYKLCDYDDDDDNGDNDEKTFTLQEKQQWVHRSLILPENKVNLNHCDHRTLDPMKITTIINTFVITTILKIKIMITFMITHLENNNPALLLWSVLLPSSSQPFV